MVWVLLIIYILAWVYLGEKLLVPLHDKWEEKVEPDIQSLVGLIGLWIVKGIMAMLILFIWFIPVMWIIERF